MIGACKPSLEMPSIGLFMGSDGVRGSLKASVCMESDPPADTLTGAKHPTANQRHASWIAPNSLPGISTPVTGYVWGGGAAACGRTQDFRALLLAIYLSMLKNIAVTKEINHIRRFLTFQGCQ